MNEIMRIVAFAAGEAGVTLVRMEVIKNTLVVNMEDFRRSLASIKRALREGGHLVVKSDDPLNYAWIDSGERGLAPVIFKEAW